MTALPTANARSETSDAPPRHQSAAVAGAAIAISCAGLLPLGVQPILLGGLASAGRLNDVGVGQVATAEILCLAFGSVIAPSLLSKGGMRAKAAVAAVLLALVNAAIAWAANPAEILLQRSIAGALEGFLIGPAIVILTHSRNPARMNGILLGVTLIPQIIAAYLIPAALTPRFGIQSGFLVLSLAAVAAACAAPAIVDRVPMEVEPSFKAVRWSARLGVLITAVFLQNMGLGAAWSYVERLSDLDGFASATAGLAVAASLGLQIVGSLTGAYLSIKAPLRTTLMIGALAQVAFTALMVLAHTPAVFIFSVSAFGLFWPGLQPFQVGEMIHLEPTRRVAMLIGPIVLGGNAIGPLAVSFVIEALGVRTSYWAAAGMLSAAAVMYALLARPGVLRAKATS